MILELLFLLCVAYAIRDAWNASWSAVGTARTNARKQATARGGRHNTEAVARRAARQATAGWWAGEIRHGLPTTRHGFAHGWAEHRQLMAERAKDAARRDAAHAQQRATWAAEIAAYRHSRQVADRKAARPSMSDQLRADVTAQAGNGSEPSPKQWRVPNPPLADGHTPGSSPAASTGNHQGGTMADINYDEVIKTSNELVAAADNAVSNTALGQATALADGLGAMLRSDPATCGLAADVAAAAARVQAANIALMEAATALRERTMAAYEQMKEAADASDAAPPEPEFLES